MSRTRLPNTRPGLTHKATVGGVEFYLTVGLAVELRDGIPVHRPAELFITIADEVDDGPFAGFADAWATAVSVALQHGWSLADACAKFRGMSFEPCGWTSNTAIGYAKSIPDYVARWLILRFGGEPKNAFEAIGAPSVDPRAGLGRDKDDGENVEQQATQTRPCPNCGVQMAKIKGATCMNCGTAPDT